MEAKQNSTDALTEEQLRNAGASALFVAYYKAASPKATARSEVDRGPFTLEELNNSPHLGGGFFKALWNGNEVEARRRADTNNSRILDSL